MNAIIVPSLILLAGVIDDIMTKKVHNYLAVAGLLVGGMYSYFFGGKEQLVLGLLALGLTFCLYAPLFLMKIIGGGDVKLMLAFSITTNWQTVLNLTFYAFIWALVFGLIRAALDKKLMNVFRNVFQMITTKTKVEAKDLNRIPFTVALFFGWLSHLAVNGGRI